MEAPESDEAGLTEPSSAGKPLPFVSVCACSATASASFAEPARRAEGVPDAPSALLFCVAAWMPCCTLSADCCAAAWSCVGPGGADRKSWARKAAKMPPSSAPRTAACRARPSAACAFAPLAAAATAAATLHPCLSAHRGSKGRTKCRNAILALKRIPEPLSRLALQGRFCRFGKLCRLNRR